MENNKFSYFRTTGHLVAAASALAVVACGGGGENESNNTGSASQATCSRFTYQQDAQAYMIQYGATQLDADHDGVACESLPKRTSSVPGSTAGASYPTNSVFVTQLASFNSFRVSAPGWLQSSYKILAPNMDSDFELSLSASAATEIFQGYRDTHLELELARASSGLLIGTGNWPGFNGYSGVRGIGMEMPLVLPAPTWPENKTYVFLGGSTVSVNFTPMKGVLELKDGQMRVCPETSAVTSDCTNGFMVKFSSGGPIWDTEDKQGTLLIAHHGILAYRSCKNTWQHCSVHCYIWNCTVGD